MERYLLRDSGLLIVSLISISIQEQEYIQQDCAAIAELAYR